MQRCCRISGTRMLVADRHECTPTSRGSAELPDRLGQMVIPLVGVGPRAPRRQACGPAHGEPARPGHALLEGARARSEEIERSHASRCDSVSCRPKSREPGPPLPTRRSRTRTWVMPRTALPAATSLPRRDRQESRGRGDGFSTEQRNQLGAECDRACGPTEACRRRAWSAQPEQLHSVQVEDGLASAVITEPRGGHPS